MTDLDEVLARLNPKTREKIRLADQLTEDRQPLSSLGITRALGGGLRYGTICLLWGNRSGSKSSLALGTLGLAQKDGKVCAIVDAEGSYSKGWATQLGVDTESVILSPVKSMEGCTDTCVDLMKSGVEVIVIDSLSALLPGSYFEKDGELKDQSSTGQIGQFSKDLGKMLTMFNYVNESTLIILISQVRNNIGTMHASLTPMGGKALEHFNSTSIKIFSSLADAEQITGEVYNGDIVLKEKIGRKVNWLIDKDRGPGMWMNGTYNFYMKGDHIGVDNVAELLDVGVTYGIIEKSGNWFLLGDAKMNGPIQAADYLREHQDLYRELEDRIVREVH